MMIGNGLPGMLHSIAALLAVIVFFITGFLSLSNLFASWVAPTQLASYLIVHCIIFFTYVIIDFVFNRLHVLPIRSLYSKRERSSYFMLGSIVSIVGFASSWTCAGRSSNSYPNGNNATTLSYFIVNSLLACLCIFVCFEGAKEMASLWDEDWNISNSKTTKTNKKGKE